MQGGSLKTKTIKGVGWSAVDNISYYAVTFIVGIVLARLLSPEEFGLVGLTVIITELCNTIINGGFSSALVRKQNATEEDYNTAFITNMFVSLLLYVVVFFSSPFIASFFERQELVNLTRVSSLNLIIGALSIVQRTRIEKKIDFESLAKVTFITSLVGGLVGILLAFQGYGVWALVIQGLIRTTLQAILFFRINKWIPKCSFSVNSFQCLFGYGWKILITNLMSKIWSEMNEIVIGKIYSPSTLGQYSRGKQFTYLTSGNLTEIIQRVTFPVLSSIQNDKERLRTAYKRALKITMFITVPFNFFLASISKPLIYCLIGPKWHEASVYLPLLCFASFLYPFIALNLNMFQVHGRSDLFLGLGIVHKVLAIVPLLLGVFVGILPMLYANIILWVVMSFFYLNQSKKLLGFGVVAQIGTIIPSLVTAIVVYAITHLVLYMSYSYWLLLPIQVVLGFAAFFTVSELFHFEEYIELKGIAVSYISQLKRRFCEK